LGRPTGPRKNAGRARVVSPQASSGPTHIKIEKEKKFAFVYINYFFYGLLH